MAKHVEPVPFDFFSLLLEREKTFFGWSARFRFLRFWESDDLPSR
jgi:hypothetical protein